MEMSRGHLENVMNPTSVRQPGTTAREIGDTLERLRNYVPLQRWVVHAGDVLYTIGARFTSLFVPNSGYFKDVILTADGREQVVWLHFKGDWLGFDGIAEGRYGCNAVALDTGEVWSLSYDHLLSASARQPDLLTALHAAMSRQISRDHELMLALATLPADVRVADFLRNWAGSLAERGLRTDKITFPLTRAEVGSYLGMTLESVSRALSRLDGADVIRVDNRFRRDIEIPEVAALTGFIERNGLAAAVR